MSTRSRRRPLSVPNLVIGSVGLAGAVATAVTGNILGTIFLGLLTVGVIVTALVTRNIDARDVTRINALEYRDERDSQLAVHGFAVTGATALAIAAVEVVAGTFASRFLSQELATFVLTTACVQLIVLCVVWGAANIRAVRRG